MNNNGEANQGSGRWSQNAKAGKSNRKRPLGEPVGISGTSPNKNRSLLRLVRQLSQKCTLVERNVSVFIHQVYYWTMYLTRTRPIWALCSVTVVLGYVGIEGTTNEKQQRMRLFWAASFRHSCQIVTIQVVKEWGLESAVRFREENLAKATSLVTEE